MDGLDLDSWSGGKRGGLERKKSQDGENMGV